MKSRKASGNYSSKKEWQHLIDNKDTPPTKDEQKKTNTKRSKNRRDKIKGKELEPISVRDKWAISLYNQNLRASSKSRKASVKNTTRNRDLEIVSNGNYQNINRQRTNSNLSVENREELIQKYYKENRDELLAHYEKVLKVTSEPNIIDLTEMSNKAQNISALGILPTNSGRIPNSSNKRSTSPKNEPKRTRQSNGDNRERYSAFLIPQNSDNKQSLYLNNSSTPKGNRPLKKRKMR